MSEKYFVSENTQLMVEWDWEKNGEIGIDPNIITCGSHKTAYWKCNKGHSWFEKIEVRNRGYRCPYCSGKRPIKGENDFATVHLELLGEWNYERNTLLPEELLPSSGQKVWWRCEKGHEWQASLNNRHKGTGCPICAKEANSSFPEIAIAFYLSKCIHIENRRKIFNREVDIYIPSLNVGIEYDGIYFHKNAKVQKRDEEKSDFLTQKGVFLIRIKEASYNQFDEKNKIIFVKFDNQYRYINETVCLLIKYINRRFNINLQTDVDIERDRLEILSYFKTLKRRNSLAERNPLLAYEWNYSKNLGLLPEYFDISSKHKVWWICEKGHEWEASIYSRTAGNGCPYCANQKLLKGYNDLCSIAPNLEKEWNYEKNAPLLPEDVVAGTDRIIWWKCNKGHEWKARISNRLRGNKCPYCANKKVLSGENDLKTWCDKNNMSHLLKEFDYEKNDFDITEVTPCSSKMVWWKCSYGHSYSTLLSHRTNMHTSCPYCSNKKILSGYNDLATTHPEIAMEWDFNKNNGVTPSDVMAGSNAKKYWFICPDGHSYSATLLNRKKGRGCPKCYKESLRR